MRFFISNGSSVIEVTKYRHINQEAQEKKVKDLEEMRGKQKEEEKKAEMKAKILSIEEEPEVAVPPTTKKKVISKGKKKRKPGKAKVVKKKVVPLIDLTADTDDEKEASRQDSPMAASNQRQGTKPQPQSRFSNLDFEDKPPPLSKRDMEDSRSSIHDTGPINPNFFSTSPEFQSRQPSNRSQSPGYHPGSQDIHQRSPEYRSRKPDIHERGSRSQNRQRSPDYHSRRSNNRRLSPEYRSRSPNVHKRSPDPPRQSRQGTVPDLASIKNQLLGQLQQLETGSLLDAAELVDIADKLKKVQEQQKLQQQQSQGYSAPSRSRERNTKERSTRFDSERRGQMLDLYGARGSSALENVRDRDLHETSLRNLHPAIPDRRREDSPTQIPEWRQEDQSDNSKYDWDNWDKIHKSSAVQSGSSTSGNHGRSSGYHSEERRADYQSMATSENYSRRDELTRNSASAMGSAGLLNAGNQMSSQMQDPVQSRNMSQGNTGYTGISKSGESFKAPTKGILKSSRSSGESRTKGSSQKNKIGEPSAGMTKLCVTNLPPNSHWIQIKQFFNDHLKRIKAIKPVQNVQKKNNDRTSATVSVNGHDMTVVTHKKAVDYIQRKPVLNMLVHRPGVPQLQKGAQPQFQAYEQQYSPNPQYQRQY